MNGNGKSVGLVETNRNLLVPKALKSLAMTSSHKSERILFQLFSNSVIVIVIVIVARMRVSRVGVK